MITMVCFRAGGTAYCMPVEATRSVRLALGMVALPEPNAAIAGILSGDPPLTVLSPLATSGEHVLVVEAADKTFGLLVDAVTGLRRVDSDDIGARPDGQNRPLVCGTVLADGQLVLIADPNAMVTQL